jgi:hypothetical protein
LNYFNYFTEIEETFIRRRGRNLLLSPLDWALIENWQEREIPLHIVLRAIENVFDTVDKQPSRKRAVKSLFYCKEEIEAQYAEWLEMQTGAARVQSPKSKVQSPKSEVQSSKFKVQGSSGQNLSPSKNDFFSADSIEIHLENVSADLEAAKRTAKGEFLEILERVLSRLEELKTDISDAEKLEQSLEKLDNLLDESLLNSTAPEALSVLKTKTEKNLAAYKNKMEQEVYQRTFDLMLLKQLRERANVPRLSLFYL